MNSIKWPHILEKKLMTYDISCPTINPCFRINYTCSCDVDSLAHKSQVFIYLMYRNNTSQESYEKIYNKEVSLNIINF